MKDFELLTAPSREHAIAPFERSLQTRESFPAVSARANGSDGEGSVLGRVQVADEAGFAYLDGDIDFGATGRNEIFQNIKYIILTEYFSVPLDREFGMDYRMVDKPMAIAEAILSQEVAMKITLYEPRAQFREISYVRDEMIGKLSPSVKVVLITTDELPGSVPVTVAASVGGAAGVIIEEVDLPGFYESLIEMARVPGPPGPIGPEGDAATIEAGTTTTGASGTQAIVTNVGTSSEAIFDFVIPAGEKGDQGTGITIKGTVPNSGSLPTTGNQPGDMWIATDTGHGWTWDGTQWVDAGPIQGPPGPTGPQGIQGIQGIQGPQGITGPVGPEGPQGDEGATGPQGATGSQGATGPQGPQGNFGPTGPVGPAGPPNVLSVSGTTTGPPGTNANVSISGTSPSQSLSFTIPSGVQGPQGIQGPQGPPGLPVGAIVDYGGATEPSGWVFCFGQALARIGTYADLFAAIGTAWGAGDGSTTFNVPDLRGYILAGKDNMGGTDAGRLNTAGAQATTLGGTMGNQIHTLTAAQIPAHAHTYSDFYQGLIPGGALSGGAAYTLGGANQARSTDNSTGGGGAHNNIQPTRTANKIIKY